jgi:rare lipoprotein A
MRPMNFTHARGAMTLAAVLTTVAAGAAVAQAQAPGMPGTPEAGAATPTAPVATAKSGTAKKQRSRTTVRSARHNLDLGQRVLVRGTVSPNAAGHRVRLQVRSGSGWKSVARATTGKGGAYRLRYTPTRAAALNARVLFLGDATSRSSQRTVGTVNVYRRAQASWYGPGLYGNQLGCGGRLSPGTLGVANKTLPCGTEVTLRYNGRSVRVPVIDRGPYVAGREYDLTSATRSRLGFSGTGAVRTTR